MGQLRQYVTACDPTVTVSCAGAPFPLHLPAVPQPSNCSGWPYSLDQQRGPADPPCLALAWPWPPWKPPCPSQTPPALSARVLRSARRRYPRRCCSPPPASRPSTRHMKERKKDLSPLPGVHEGGACKQGATKEAHAVCVARGCRTRCLALSCALLCSAHGCTAHRTSQTQSIYGESPTSSSSEYVARFFGADSALSAGSPWGRMGQRSGQAGKAAVRPTQSTAPHPISQQHTGASRGMQAQARAACASASHLLTSWPQVPFCPLLSCWAPACCSRAWPATWRAVPCQRPRSAQHPQARWLSAPALTARQAQPGLPARRSAPIKRPERPAWMPQPRALT
jgi:hypothetical protein